MKLIRKRLAAAVLAAVLTGSPGGLILRSAALEADGTDSGRQISTRTHGTVFTVLGISFLCAGGIAALTAIRDRK